MKLRPVVLVLLLLSGFYYVTTRSLPSGRLKPVLRGFPTIADPAGDTSSVDSAFDLREASAAPAFDEEEQQNIAVYRKALPFGCQHYLDPPSPSTSSIARFRSRARARASCSTSRAISSPTTTSSITLSGSRSHSHDKHKYKATVVGIDKGHDLALLLINAPNLVPATLAESGGLVVGQRVYAIGNPFGLSGTMTRGIISAIRSIGVQGGATDRGRHPDRRGRKPRKFRRARCSTPAVK